MRQSRWPITRSMERHLILELPKEIALFGIQVTVKCKWHLQHLVLAAVHKLIMRNYSRESLQAIHLDSQMTIETSNF